jgi:hypothetical protein
LPVVRRRRFAGSKQRLQIIDFSSHAFFAASRVPKFCRGAGETRGIKKADWPKTFLLNAAGFPYNFCR